MRAKVVSDRSSGTEWLEVRLSAGERADAAGIGWLRARPHRYLLEVQASPVPSPSVLRYAVTGLESLRSFLRHYQITPFQYENILVSAGEALGMLGREGQDAGSLLLDDRSVFSDLDGNLWFVYLPLERPGDAQEDTARDPSAAFLRHLARGRRVAFASSDDLARSRRLREALRKPEVSLGTYEDFLVGEYGIRLDLSDAGEGPIATPVAAASSEEARGAGGARYPRHARDVALTVPRGDWDDGVTSVATLDPLPKEAPGEGAAASQGSRTTAFRLVALDGSGTSYALGDCRSVLVGRGSACDVRIPDDMRVSRTHARIEREGDAFRVTDLGSSNGTYVRGAGLGYGDSELVGLGEAFEVADLPLSIQKA